LAKYGHKVNKFGRINKVRVNLGGLDELLDTLQEQYTVRVGIQGEEAQAKHEGSTLTNAELGAVHEFGATINVTEKMRGFFWHKWGIHKSNNPIVIPTRSFLRMPLLDSEGRKAVINKVIEASGGDEALAHFLKTKNKKVFNESDAADNYIREKAKGYIGKTFMSMLADQIGFAAVSRVQNAFETSGFGKWPAITQFTKDNRIGDPDNPPLQDTGDLMESITHKVVKH
jgi:phage gpG-like protein